MEVKRNMQTVVRRVCDSDMPELIELWRMCFPEDDEFCSFFFDRMYSPSAVRVAEFNGEVAGALYVFDYTFSTGERAWYIYGVGTHTRMRGKGIAGALINSVLNEAEKAGVDLCMLVPQDEGLFGFYKKFGFYPNFYREKRVAKNAGNRIDIRRALPQDIPQINAVYEACLAGCPYVLRTEYEWRLILDEYQGAGAVYVQESGGRITAYAVCIADKGKITVYEIFGDKSDDLLSSIDGESIEYYLPGGDIPYGSACPITQAGERILNSGKTVYMNLMHS